MAAATSGAGIQETVPAERAALEGSASKMRVCERQFAYICDEGSEGG